MDGASYTNRVTAIYQSAASGSTPVPITLKRLQNLLFALSTDQGNGQRIIQIKNAIEGCHARNPGKMLNSLDAATRL